MKWAVAAAETLNAPEVENAARWQLMKTKAKKAHQH
jgi:hypothetical protein